VLYILIWFSYSSSKILLALYFRNYITEIALKKSVCFPLSTTFLAFLQSIINHTTKRVCRKLLMLHLLIANIYNNNAFSKSFIVYYVGLLVAYETMLLISYFLCILKHICTLDYLHGFNFVYLHPIRLKIKKVILQQDSTD